MFETDQFIASMDTPAQSTVTNIFRASGWFLDKTGRPADSVRFLVNGKACASAARSSRLDVAKVCPQWPLAASAGFFGDIVLNPLQTGASFDLSVEFRVAGRVHRIDVGAFASDMRPAERPVKISKSFDYDTILQKPNSHVNASQILGAHHFYDPHSPAIFRLLEDNTTHGYSETMLDIIGRFKDDGLVLDLGCGIRPNDTIFPHVALLDAVHFPTVEVVSACETLPFKDSVFDAVISNAVFEHLPDPWGMAREIKRILKPGGIVHVCTAFMQPFHGDPDHYFNMTIPGLKMVFCDFKILDEGVEWFQCPSHSLMMQAESMKPYLSEDNWEKIFGSMVRALLAERNIIDLDINEMGRRTLAAGVSITAAKLLEL